MMKIKIHNNHITIGPPNRADFIYRGKAKYFLVGIHFRLHIRRRNLGHEYWTYDPALLKSVTDKQDFSDWCDRNNADISDLTDEEFLRMRMEID